MRLRDLRMNFVLVNHFKIAFFATPLENMELFLYRVVEHIYVVGIVSEIVFGDVELVRDTAFHNDNCVQHLPGVDDLLQRSSRLLFSFCLLTHKRDLFLFITIRYYLSSKQLNSV